MGIAQWYIHIGPPKVVVTLVKSFRWSTDIDVPVMASACFFLCGDNDCNYLRMSYWGWGCVRSMNKHLSFTTCSYSSIIEQVPTSDDLHSWWWLASRFGIRLHLPDSTPGRPVMTLMIFEVIMEYLINGWRSHESKRSAPFYVTQHLLLDLQMKQTRMNCTVFGWLFIVVESWCSATGHSRNRPHYEAGVGWSTLRSMVE